MSRPAKEGFERLGPPRRGEWRALFDEPRQTFDDYVARCSNRASTEHRRLYLEPLGEAGRHHAARLQRVREYAELFFGLETRLLSARPLLDPAHVPTRDQHNSSMILDSLVERVPADGLALLGICDVDLFARGKRYVFGEGSLERRAGVCSFFRLSSPDAGLVDRRAVRLVTHETGHLLSIAHCVTHRCVMQGSNTLQESDHHPLHLCPEDLRKLEWNTGVDRSARYRNLLAYCRRAGWSDEAEWIKRTVLHAQAEG